jgi:ubiquitin C-terminal hydrolase
LALEWDDKALTLLQAAIKVPPRVLHPSVRALAHLEEGLSLSSCFESFCKEEQMAPGEEYYCGKCKLHVRGTKAMRLAKCPEVLVLTLKRFSKQLGFAGRFLPAKLQDLVTFPVDGLDVAPYLLGSAELLRDDDAPAPGSSGFDAGGQSTVYDLFACVNHYGHANFGHYKAAVRGGEWAGGVQTAGGAPTGDVPTGAQWTRSSGRAAETPEGKTAATQPNGRVLPDLWFDYDDDTVTKIANGESVVSKAAYVLFYRRRAGGATNNAARL